MNETQRHASIEKFAREFGMKRALLVEKYVRAAITSQGYPLLSKPNWLGKLIVRLSGVRITQSTGMDGGSKVCIFIHDRLYATVETYISRAHVRVVGRRY